MVNVCRGLSVQFVALFLASLSASEIGAQQANVSERIEITELSISTARAVQIAFNSFGDQGLKSDQFRMVTVRVLSERITRVTFRNKTETGLLGSHPDFPDWEFYVDVVDGTVLRISQSM